MVDPVVVAVTVVRRAVLVEGCWPSPGGRARMLLGGDPSARLRGVMAGRAVLMVMW